jgi:hypothetical protein
MFAKKAVAQIPGGINIGRIIYMAVGIDIRPSDLIRSGILIHVARTQPFPGMTDFLILLRKFPTPIALGTILSGTAAFLSLARME